MIWCMYMKRYQVYLNQHSVNILDELAEISDFNRSQIMREAIDAITMRFTNILAALKPPSKQDYRWLDDMVGAIKIKGKKEVHISENIDEIYYK